MKTIKASNGFSVTFNGKNTYFVDNGCECIGYYETERKAINAMNRAIKHSVL